MKLNRKTGIGTLPEIPVATHEYDCRQVIESLPVAVYTCDLEGRITFYNDAAAALWGDWPVIGKDQWCGSWKIYTPEGKRINLDECPMAITLKEGRAIQEEEIIIERQDGLRIHVIAHPKPLYDADGNLRGAVNMLMDVTEKRERENALALSEKKYRLLSESLEKKVEAGKVSIEQSENRYLKMTEEVEDYAILLLDEKGNIMNWNKGAEKIKGYKENEIIGKNFRVFYREEDRTSKLPESLIELARSNGKAMHEGWRLRKDGRLFWGSIVITALHDAQGRVIGFSKVTRDLTEKKQADDQLKKYAREIELRNKRLEEYTYIASHDLQEPLRKIQLFSELIKNKPADKTKTEKYIERIDLAARRMTTLIKEVLNYSHATQVELFKTTDLNIILQNVIQDFDLAIEERHAKITSMRLPVIQGIPIQLHQLFSNLLSNAIKFSKQDPVIDITSEQVSNNQLGQYPELSEGNEYYKITFKDNGVGFDPQYSEKIFKLFRQLSDSTFGTGTGLAICKRVVENHDGHISVVSKPNEGTSFSIFLPVSQGLVI